MNINLPKGGTIVAIGLGTPFKAFFDALVEYGLGPQLVVITDQTIDPAPEIIEQCKSVGAAFHDVSASEPSSLDAIMDGIECPTGCVLGWHAILPKGFIARFDGRLFNWHCGDLPRYRGAGGYSWQVLNGETEIKAHIHAMLPKVDAGPIVLIEAEQIENISPYPEDFMRSAEKAGARAAYRFGAMVARGEPIKTSVVQREDLAEYYPKLFTPAHGFIDFSWGAVELERFVRAFSRPYPGASFRYGDDLFRVRCARGPGPTISDIRPRHPFTAGLIANRTLDGLYVLTRDGLLLLSDFVDAGGHAVLPDHFRIGARLWNEPDDLLNALRYRP